MKGTKLIEEYRGLHIYKRDQSYYYVDEYQASVFISLEVAKKCIDILLESFVREGIKWQLYT